MRSKPLLNPASPRAPQQGFDLLGVQFIRILLLLGRAFLAKGNVLIGDRNGAFGAARFHDGELHAGTDLLAAIASDQFWLDLALYQLVLELVLFGNLVGLAEGLVFPEEAC